MARKINERIMCSLLGNSNILLHRIAILVLTFLIYATYHMSRKPMSVVKSKLNHNDTGKLESNWAPFDKPNAKTLLSVMDGCYWGAYAIGMFFTGFLAERSNLRYFLSAALTLCGVFCIIFGLAYPLGIHSLPFFIIIQILNGLFQTTGWPSVLAIVGPWFAGKKKGLIFGIWNLHTNFGNILGLTIAGAFVDTNWGFSFMVPGFVCIGMAVIVFLFIVPRPSDIGINLEMNSSDNSTSQPSQMNNNTLNKNGQNITINYNQDKEQAISLLGALKIPGVIEFSICLAFTKSVSYIFLNWLPKYLEEKSNLSSKNSAYASIMFDIGGMVGSIIAGLIADLSDVSGLTCIVFLSLAIPSLFLFEHFSYISMNVNQALQFIAGFFINGPYALITTAVSANLACKVPSKSAMATVSAIIDGTGSIGAAIGPAITGPMADHLGWESIFHLSMVLDFVALLCLIRVGWEEIQKILNKKTYSL